MQGIRCNDGIKNGLAYNVTKRPNALHRVGFLCRLKKVIGIMILQAVIRIITFKVGDAVKDDWVGDI